MKKTLLFLACSSLVFFSCKQKTESAQPQEETTVDTTVVAEVSNEVPDEEEATEVEPASDEEILCGLLEKFLSGDPSCAYLSESAENDVLESSWPEAQCPVVDCSSENCGPLFSPGEGTGLKVTPCGKNKYVYSVICPCGCGKRFKDFTTMEAYLMEEAPVVEIRHVVWN